MSQCCFKTFEEMIQWWLLISLWLVWAAEHKLQSFREQQPTFVHFPLVYSKASNTNVKWRHIFAWEKALIVLNLQDWLFLENLQSIFQSWGCYNTRAYFNRLSRVRRDVRLRQEQSFKMHLRVYNTFSTYHLRYIVKALHTDGIPALVISLILANLSYFRSVWMCRECLIDMSLTSPFA